MQWSDDGIVLSVRPHAETAAVLELLTRDNGRCLGLVHGGRSRRLRPVLQPGNRVKAEWRARLSEQLGTLTVDLEHGYAAELMEHKLPLLALECLTTLARLLPERDPHPALFEVSLFVLGYLGEPAVWPALYARWEVMLLAELGFGLDLATCAVTGSDRDLVWVSPRTGRAVSSAAGEPYRQRLLRLPAFLRDPKAGLQGPDDIRDALALTAWFLESRLYAPRGERLPEVRLRLAASPGLQGGAAVR